MPRPCCQRRTNCQPNVKYFKPIGIPLHMLEEVVITIDEIETLLKECRNKITENIKN